MRFSTKISIGLALILALIVLYFADDHLMHKKEDQQKQSSVALYFQPEDVRWFSLTNKQGVFSFERKSKQDPWTSADRPKMHVEQSAVNQMLSTLSEISIQQNVPNLMGDKETQEWKSSGIEKPEMTMEITLENGKRQTLLIGNPIFKMLSVYAKSSEKKELIIVDSSFQPEFDSKSWKDFYSKQMGSFFAPEVSEITIDRINKKTILKKDQDTWTLVTSQISKTDETFVKSYIQMYQMLMAQQIYLPAEVQSMGPDKFNLKSQSARITFKDADGKTLQSFPLSLTREGIFTPLEDGSVAQMPLETWPDLVPEQIQFQNRTIMLDKNMDDVTSIRLTPSFSLEKEDGKWSSKDVVEFLSLWKTLKAENIIPSPTEDDLKSYGLKNPLKTFSFVFKINSHQISVDIIIGSRVPNNERSMYIKRSDSPFIYTVNADWLSLLAKLEP